MNNYKPLLGQLFVQNLDLGEALAPIIPRGLAPPPLGLAPPVLGLANPRGLFLPPLGLLPTLFLLGELEPPAVRTEPRLASYSY